MAADRSVVDRLDSPSDPTTAVLQALLPSKDPNPTISSMNLEELFNNKKAAARFFISQFPDHEAHWSLNILQVLQLSKIPKQTKKALSSKIRNSSTRAIDPDTEITEFENVKAPHVEGWCYVEFWKLCRRQ